MMPLAGFALGVAFGLMVGYVLWEDGRGDGPDKRSGWFADDLADDSLDALDEE